MKPFHFCGPSYQALSPNWSNERAVNFICENSESEGAKTPRGAFRAPGKTAFATLPTEISAPCVFTVNGRFFAAAANFYEVLAGGQVNKLGTLNGQPVSGNPPQIKANQNQLLILSNGNLYTLSFIGGITSANVDSGGTGYNVGDRGTINGTSASYKVTAAPGGAVSAFTVSPGANNKVQTGVATTATTGSGTGFTVNIVSIGNNVFFAVDMTQLNGPVQQIEFSDGYFLATIQNSNTWQQSNLEDGTTWSGLNIATISIFPDNITSMIVNDRQPIFFSGKKTQIYYNNGAGFPVFIPVPQALIENGCGAGFATVQLDNTVFWLDQDERGAFVARKLLGTIGKRVSTHAVELAWQSYTTASDAIGWTYQEDGHLYWMLYFPTAKAFWGYDASTDLWHERGRWNENSASFEPDHAMCHAYCFGKHLVGDWASGTIYQQSILLNTDNGYALKAFRRSPTQSKFNEWLYYSEFRLDTETGLIPTAADIAAWESVYGVPPLLDGNGNARSPEVRIRWSNNNGRTWSNEYSLDLRAQGQYGHLVRKRMLGRARNRLWEIYITDPIPFRVADAYVEVAEDMEEAIA